MRGVGEKMHTKTQVSENMLLTDCNTLPYHKCTDLQQVLMDQAKLKWLPWLLYHFVIYFILFHFFFIDFSSFRLTNKILLI